MNQKLVNDLARSLHTSPQAIAPSLKSEIYRLPFPESEILSYFCRLARSGKLVFSNGQFNIESVPPRSKTE